MLSLKIVCAFCSLVHSASCSAYVSFDDASASSMRALSGQGSASDYSPSNAVVHASGIWCSAGNHGSAQVVSWTGYVDSRIKAYGLRLSWAYSPGEYKILASSDGSNFQEIVGWTAAAQRNESYIQHVMFETVLPIKTLSIYMRAAQPWGFFGILDAKLLAEVDSVMLISGVTSPVGDLCLVASGGMQSEFTQLVLESCSAAIAEGDGRELFSMGSDGSIQHFGSGHCLVLSDASVAAGGKLVLQDCVHAKAANDGRAAWVYQASKQLELMGLQDYCASVLASGIGVKECGAAMQEDNAADKFYFVPATMNEVGARPESKNVAELLVASSAHLASLLGNLLHAKQVCGKFMSSPQNDVVGDESISSQVLSPADPILSAISAIGAAWGIDLAKVFKLLAQARSAMS